MSLHPGSDVLRQEAKPHSIGSPASTSSQVRGIDRAAGQRVRRVRSDRRPCRVVLDTSRGESGVSGVCHDSAVATTRAARRIRLDQCSSTAGWSRRGRVPRRWSSRARSAWARAMPRARTGSPAISSMSPRRCASTPAASGSAGARTSCSPRSMRSGSIPRVSSPSMSGASTGGFTDVLLRAGADASTPWTWAGTARGSAAAGPAGRLHGAARTRGTLTADSSPEPVDLAVDRRRVHLARAHARGRCASVLRDGPGPIVALVKPQFEAGRADGQGRRRARRGRPPRRASRRSRAARASWVSARARSSRRPSRARRATASSCVHLQAGPSCADLERLIDAAVDAAWAPRRSPPTA